MTADIVQRLREAAAALPAERVSMQILVQAHGSAADGTFVVLPIMTAEFLSWLHVRRFGEGLGDRFVAPVRSSVGAGTGTV